MKKIIFSLVVLSLLIQIPVFATETEQEAMSATLTNQSAGMSMNQPAGTSMPGERKPGQGNPANQMVLANDGGVIILIGPRIMKFDADLNIVKEAWVPLPKLPTERKKQLTPTAAETDQPAAAGLQEKAI